MALRAVTHHLGQPGLIPILRMVAKVVEAVIRRQLVREVLVIQSMGLLEPFVMAGSVVLVAHAESRHRLFIAEVPRLLQPPDSVVVELRVLMVRELVGTGFFR